LPGIFPERSSGKNQCEPSRPCPYTKRTKKKVLRRQAPKDSKLPQTAQEILNLFEGQIMKENRIRTGKNSSKNIEKKRRKTDERDA